MACHMHKQAYLHPTVQGVDEMRQRYVLKIFGCCTFALLGLTYGYGQNPPGTPRQNPANTTPPYNPQATRPNSDTSTQGGFLSQAIEINQAEVDLGKLAASKAMDKSVKDFA